MTEPVRPLEALIDQWRERVEKNRDRGSREHLALADGYDICADELEAALLQAAAPPAPTDPTNHHNALTCPHCNPNGLKFAEAAPPERVSEGKESDEELVPHAFNSRTRYEPGDDRDIWCADCEYHRDHEIHAARPAVEPREEPR